MSRFISSTFNLPLAWAIDLTFPAIMKLNLGLEEIEISREDKKMLREQHRERLLFLSNHPSTTEPPIAYHIANLMGSRFQYMAARQVFDWGFGVVGALIRNLGAFSVISGAADREALKAARASLAKKEGKLVLYPEGEPTSGMNDSLLPLQPGIAQLGFWGYEDARKVDPNADIKVLSAFIKYVYLGTDAKIKSDLYTSIKRIEKEFRVDPGNKNLLRRFLTIGRVILERSELQYGIAPGAEKDYDYRLGRVRHVILDGVADRMEAPGYDRSADAITKLRHLLSLLEMYHVGHTDRKMPELDQRTLEWAQRECDKAYDIIVVKPSYLVSRPTAERFYEMLTRFEMYLFGNSNPRPRKAVVSFAPLFSMASYHAEYKKDKKAGIQSLLTRVRSDLQGMLEQSLELTQPIVRPYDVGDELGDEP